MFRRSNGEFGIWWVRGDSSSQPVKLFNDTTPLQVFSISPDGRTVAFVRTGKDMGFEVWTLPLDLAIPIILDQRSPSLLRANPSARLTPRFHPTAIGWHTYLPPAREREAKFPCAPSRPGLRRADGRSRNRKAGQSFPSGRLTAGSCSMSIPTIASWSSAIPQIVTPSSRRNPGNGRQRCCSGQRTTVFGIST